jgi:hypothetical protein
MTENMQGMSVSTEAAVVPQKEQENGAGQDHVQERVEPPEALARPSAKELEVARELVRSARERGTELTGPDGLLKALTKTVIETALDEEMADHLGYGRHDPAGRNWGNSRNGSRTQTVLTDNCGPVEIEVPRDRAGSFDPAIVKKWQRRSGDVDTIVLSLHAKGLTTGEISSHFTEIYGASVSKDTISRITDKVVAERWPSGPRGRWRRSTPRSSSTPSTSRSVTARSATGRSMPRSGSTWPATRTSCRLSTPVRVLMQSCRQLIRLAPGGQRFSDQVGLGRWREAVDRRVEV